MNRQNALVELGAFITGTEAEEIADLLDSGEPIEQALDAILDSRRNRIRTLFEKAGYGDADDIQLQKTIFGLRGIQGAYSKEKKASTVWTAPRGLVRIGDLNSSRSHLIENARSSIVCSTFNFQRSSILWDALRNASHRPGLSIKVYVDTSANENGSGHNSPTPEQIASEINGAKVFRTVMDENGHYYRNHAKFLSVDHQILLVTSANFSYSAEELNIELGLRIDDETVAESVEKQMTLFEDYLYKRVI